MKGWGRGWGKEEKDRGESLKVNLGDEKNGGAYAFLENLGKVD